MNISLHPPSRSVSRILRSFLCSEADVRKDTTLVSSLAMRGLYTRRLHEHKTQERERLPSY